MRVNRVTPYLLLLLISISPAVLAVPRDNSDQNRMRNSTNLLPWYLDSTPRDLAYFLWPSYRSQLANIGISSWVELVTRIQSDTRFAADLSRDFKFGTPGAREGAYGQQPLQDEPYGTYWNPYYLSGVVATTKQQTANLLLSEWFDAETIQATLIRDAILRQSFNYMQGFTRHPVWQVQSPERQAILAAYGDPSYEVCVEEPTWWVEDGHVRFMISIQGYQDFKPVIVVPSVNNSVVPPEPVTPGTSIVDNSTWISRIPWNAGVIFGGREFCKIFPQEVVDEVGSQYLGAYSEVLFFLTAHSQQTYLYKITSERYLQFLEAARRVHLAFANYMLKYNVTWNMDVFTNDFYEPNIALPYDVHFPTVLDTLFLDIESGGVYTARAATELFAREIFNWFRNYGPYTEGPYQYDYYWRELFAYYMPDLAPMYVQMRSQIILAVNRYTPTIILGGTVQSSHMELDARKLLALVPVAYPVQLPPVIIPPINDTTQPGNELINVFCFGQDCPVDPAAVLGAYTLIGALLSGTVAGLVKRRRKQPQLAASSVVVTAGNSANMTLTVTGI